MERVWVRAMLLRSALSILSDRVPAELDGDQMRLQVKHSCPWGSQHGRRGEELFQQKQEGVLPISGGSRQRRAPSDLHPHLSALRAPGVTPLIHRGPLTRGDA